ncbi:type I-F CRISPR-associated endoribonuclease Cas6/Csy4 [Vibrio crassostreae]|uniref:type I-F CRISPR-associated endoribonuclease Cas6/Csy4 n=1 Tax=Vibrio crassostreae TaxID=246167 RepID=UPI001B313A11|nr:type I-F CRISPR-associated endoribonuclease Cas6/Csy4 [Vibrio crassostreae]
MDKYIDIRLDLSDGVTPALLVNAAVGRLHTAIVQARVFAAISFPEADKRGLGTLIRLHGGEIALKHLEDGKWLKGDKGYFCIDSLKNAPETTRHLLVQRVQKKATKSLASILRRRVKRGHITQKEMDEQMKGGQVRENLPPYIRLRSSSTQQNITIFIEQKEVTDVIEGRVGSYGLSTIQNPVTVPFF